MLTPARVAVMVVCPSALPVITKVALELPAGIVMFAGTEATAGLLLVRLITTPPAGAILLRMIIAFDVPPKTI